MYEATPPRPKGTMTGRLTLSWRNKDQALIGDGEGGYLWVDPSDPRAAEVRTLTEVATHGDVNGDGGDNLLVRGDGYHLLRSLNRVPELAEKYKGKVKLVYIDPPFNTKQSFTYYDDGVEHSVWLGMLRERLVLLKDLLASDGAIFVHLSDDELHYAKALMDEVFGRNCFVTTFMWRKVDSPNDNKVTVTPDHEGILCYTRTPEMVKNFSRRADQSILDGYKQTTEDGRRYRDRLLKKNGKNSLREDRPTMWYPLAAPDGTEVWPIHDDGREACWSLSEQAVEQFNDENRLIWKRRADPLNGGEKWVPYTREYAPMLPERPWQTIWSDLPTTRQAKAHITSLFPGATAFDTPKPEQLLERIINMASSPGEVVLDVFGGSGTTAAVAHKLGRRWVTAELLDTVFEGFTRPRLVKVISGHDGGGISSTSARESLNGLDAFGISAAEASAFQRVLKKLRAIESLGLETGAGHTEALDSLRRVTDTKTVDTTVWEGGGGFRELVVDSAVFQVSELAGMTIMSVVPGSSYEQLARSVAAQLGYRLADSLEGPIVGALGKSRLAVIDGTVDAKAVAGVLSQVDEQETVVIAATTVADDARAALRSESKGSRIISIPNDLFPKGGVIR